MKKDIQGYEGLYQISNDGTVFSKPRHSSKGGALKAYKTKHGYCKLNLCKDGKPKLFYVHDLVAAAFIGDKPNGFQVRHLNGNGYDNRAENLAYGTQADNEADKIPFGLDNKGSRHGNSKLTENDVLNIRSITNISHRKIAKLFNVSQTTISLIMKRKLWSHV